MKKAVTITRTKASRKSAAKSRPNGRTKAVKPHAPSATVEPAFQSVAADFADDPEVGLGRMFSSNSVLNVNGKIFAMFVRGSFVAKLPKTRVAELVSTGVGAYFDPGHGRLMKEWVAVTDATVPWVALAREAHAFVRGGTRRGSSAILQ